MDKQTIYTKVLNELDRNYIFTRYGLERRYNSLLKLRQSTVDTRLIKLINEVLESYKGLSVEPHEIDLDTFILKDNPNIMYMHSYKEIMAIMNSKFSRANLRNYCMEAQKIGFSDEIIARQDKRGNHLINCVYNNLYTLKEITNLVNK